MQTITTSINIDQDLQTKLARIDEIEAAVFGPQQMESVGVEAAREYNQLIEDISTTALINLRVAYRSAAGGR